MFNKIKKSKSTSSPKAATAKANKESKNMGSKSRKTKSSKAEDGAQTSSATSLVDQAKAEIGESLQTLFDADPSFEEIFENMVEPEYIHQWKAVWEDDQGQRHINRCWRVQQNSALGPYKGGLRYDPSVTVDTLRFLALEQTFKNALTGKQMGGGKGGSDFNPKGKSDSELRRFCEAFMLGLRRVIGPNKDVPAGDIGVGGKVIGYLYGAWRKFGGDHEGMITGKGLDWGGSNIRTEATGYGIIYILNELMKNQKVLEVEEKGESRIVGKNILISGAGNVATYAAKKAIELGAKVLSMSDRKGTFWCENGLSEDDVESILQYKRSGIKKDLSKSVTLHEGSSPWNTNVEIQVDIAIPAATQNEVSKKDAAMLIEERSCKIICEGSNMASTNTAVDLYRKHKNDIVYVGAKLANLGGVGTSFLEMEQNASKSVWSREEVDTKLNNMMIDAYKMAKDAADFYNVPLTDGANIAAFLKVAGAMKDLGYA